MKKYKLILLKDLPQHPAGTEVLNISEDEFNGTKDYEYRYYAEKYNYSEIYDLRNNPEWVKVEEDTRCDCITKDSIKIFGAIIGYGRSVNSYLDFKDKTIRSWYDQSQDCGKSYELSIKCCPLCGRKL